MSSYPTQTLMVTPLLPESDRQNVLVLPRVWSSGDCINIYSDKLGRIRKVPGHVVLNSTPYQTQELADASLVAMAPYLAPALGEDNLRIIGVWDDGINDMEIAFSDDFGVTWTFIYKIVGAQGVIPDFAQFEDTLYIAVPGSDPLQVEDTTVSRAGGARSPDATAIEVSPGAGTLSGQYQWRIVSTYIDTDGIKQRYPAGDPSLVLAIENGFAQVDWQQDAVNANVDGYEVYRTFGGSQLFRLVDFVKDDASPSYTYQDTTRDGDLLASRYLNEHGTPVPTGMRYCEVYNQRMIWGHTPDKAQRAFISDPGFPAAVNPAFSFRDFDEGGDATDRIVAIVGRFQGTWVVFLRRAIYRVSGTGELIGGIPDWTVFRTNSSTGAVTNRSIVQIPEGARYVSADGEITATDRPTLAYYTSFNDLRLFDGNADTIISYAIHDSIEQGNADALDKVHAHHDRDKQIVQWYFPIGFATKNNHGIVWNYRDGTFSTMNGQEFGSSLVVPRGTSTDVIVVGSNKEDGLAHENWAGILRNGLEFFGRWVSKPLTLELREGGPAITQKNRWLSVDIFAMADLDQYELDISWWPDWATIEREPHGVQRIDVQSQDERHLVRSMQMISDNDGAYMVSSAARVAVQDTGKDWGVEAIALVLKQLERRYG